jgi:hypothetical protein
MRAFVLCQAALASAQMIFDTRYALTFSPTTISASRYPPYGQIEVTKFPVGPSYQQLYDDALHYLQGPLTDSVHRVTYRNSTHDQNIIDIMHTEISTVTAGLTEKLGTEPEYAAIFRPIPRAC